MTDLEKQLTAALWKAWKELNTIRARDGVPRTFHGWKSDVSEDYFSEVVDECGAAITAATGKPPEPWPPRL
jgi:hypothetical protein